MNIDIGLTKGDVCNRNGCNGIINEYQKEGCCSCHINPPCTYCTTSSEYCPKCEWDGRESQIEHEKTQQEADKEYYILYKSMLHEYEARNNKVIAQMKGELPIDKIDYIIKSHTHFSMICDGVYPKGTNKEQVLELVRGTFGGRFTLFYNGRFTYIAYTD